MSRLDDPKVRARITKNKRRFAEAWAAVPEPTEPDAMALVLAMQREGMPPTIRSGVQLTWAEVEDIEPETDLRSALYDRRVLCWLEEHYPEEP